jgi:oligoendopeptidase F
MKKFVFILAGIGIACLLSTGVVLAADGAIQTLARITMNLNHFPSDADKAELQAIIDSDDATEEEADIAMAVANFQHKVAEKDTERLTDIVNDDSSEADSRTLASILLRTNHTPSDDDKMALAALAK